MRYRNLFHKNPLMNQIIRLSIISLTIIFDFAFVSFAQNNIDYKYDNLDRLLKLQYSNGTIIEYGYDELGNRVSKTVAALSHPLQISSIPNQDTALNTPVINIDFTVSSTGTSVTTLLFSGSSSNQTLVPDANIVFGGSGGKQNFDRHSGR